MTVVVYMLTQRSNVIADYEQKRGFGVYGKMPHTQTHTHTHRKKKNTHTHSTAQDTKDEHKNANTFQITTPPHAPR